MDVAGLVIGVVGVVLAVVALARARSANTLANWAVNEAKEANRLSREANSLSERANDYAQTQLSLATEQHDVTWDVDTFKAQVNLRNESDTTTALKVSVRVTFDGVERRKQAAAVEPGEVLVVHAPEVGDAREKDRRHRAGARRIGAFAELPLFHQLWYRVDWVTPGGSPKVEEKGWSFTFDEETEVPI